jgi:hypothetical protein
MRINEDYLDDIELDDLQTDVQVNPDIDTREFKYKFLFCTKEMTKNKDEQWYVSRLERFYSLFMRTLDRLSFIKDYSREFPISFGYLLQKDEYDEHVTEHGLRLRYRHDDKHSYISLSSFFFATGENKFFFTLGIDCKKIDTLEDIRRILLMLWNAFEGCLKIAFGAGCKPQHIRYWEPRQFPGSAQIDAGCVSMWKNRPDSKPAKKLFLDAYRAFHQDMMPKEIRPIVDAFCGEQPDVREFFKSHDINSYYVGEILSNLDRASYEGDTLVLDITSHVIIRNGFIRDLREKNINLKIRYLKDITYEPYSSEFNHVENFGDNLNWFIDNIAPSVEKITLSFDPTALVDFQDVPLDLTKMFPGKTVVVRVKQTSALHYVKSPRKCIVPDHDYSATIISSSGKKKYNIHVAMSYVKI